MKEDTFRAQFEHDYRAMYDAAPNDFTDLDYVGALGSIHGALLYSRILLPEFIECKGMVFLRDVFEDAGGEAAINRLYAEYGDRRKVEQSLNCFDLTLNFPNQLASNRAGDAQLLAQQLATAWRLQLQATYPERAFVVSVFDEVGEVGVIFCQAEASYSESNASE